MNVRVRLFAAAKQAAGCDCVGLDLPQRATIGALRQRLAQQLPGISDLIQQAIFAVDREYASDAAEIPDDAEVACIPPVSGG